jgi:hypothetical protein
MSTFIKAVPNDSKKEKHIQIGKHRVRIANDHHAALSELADDFREMSMEQLFFLTSFIGASLLQLFGPMVLKSVRLRAPKK